MIQLTAEQQDIIATVKNSPDGSLIKVEAVAGSSKTFTSVQVAKALGEGHMLYIAYNKAIATEAALSFPDYVECRTTHSLAYEPIVKHGINVDGSSPTPNRTLGFLSYRDINEPIPYEHKIEVIETLERFFLSSYTSLDELEKELGFPLEIERKIFAAMQEGTTPMTHSCYLKLFHIGLANDTLTYDEEYDLLILDEAGDINAVTLEIFKLIPSKKKLLVGDSLQNIYSFNHTINGFKALENVGTTKHLSKSFRCSVDIAKTVERFINSYIDSSIVFEGTDHEQKGPLTEIRISRYNSSLIEEMAELHKNGQSFGLIRDPVEIFKVVWILINLPKGKLIGDTRYKHLADEYNDFIDSAELQQKYGNYLRYIVDQNQDLDKNIVSAAKILSKHGSKKIYSIYSAAKAAYQDGDTAGIVLSTAHSSKGLTFDIVSMVNDFPVAAIKDKLRENIPISAEEQEELRLYYVACTRARHHLRNATDLY